MNSLENQIDSITHSAVKIGVEVWKMVGDSVFTEDYHNGDKACFDHVAECMRTEGKSLYAEFISKAHPAFILCLLAERDADKALIAEQDARLIEYARIATENAARTLTVNLPSQTDFDDPLSAYEAIEKCREEIKSACAAAGITLVVEE